MRLPAGSTSEGGDCIPSLQKKLKEMPQPHVGKHGFDCSCILHITMPDDSQMGCPFRSSREWRTHAHTIQGRCHSPNEGGNASPFHSNQNTSMFIQFTLQTTNDCFVYQLFMHVPVCPELIVNLSGCTSSRGYPTETFPALPFTLANAHACGEPQQRGNQRMNYQLQNE